MTTYLSATFAGADTAPGTVPNADTGQAFTQSANTGTPGWRIVSNAAYHNGNGSGHRLLADGAIADGTFTATLTALVPNATPDYWGGGLVIRATSATSGTYIILQAEPLVGFDRYGLYRGVDGAFTLIGTIAHSPTAGDMLSIVALGSTITASVGGLSITVTETSGQTNTFVGVAADGNPSASALAFDNLTATDGAAPIPTTTGSAPVSVGSSSAASLIVSTTGTIPVGVGSSSASSIVTSYTTTTGTAPVSVGSSAADSLVVATTGTAQVGTGSSSSVSTGTTTLPPWFGVNVMIKT